MSTKTIPERRVQICDACGSVCPDGAGRHDRYKEATITLRTASRCHLGDKHGEERRSWDLCDECYESVVDRLRSDRICAEDPKSGYTP